MQRGGTREEEGGRNDAQRYRASNAQRWGQQRAMRRGCVRVDKRKYSGATIGPAAKVGTLMAQERCVYRRCTQNSRRTVAVDYTIDHTARRTCKAESMAFC